MIREKQLWTCLYLFMRLGRYSVLCSFELVLICLIANVALWFSCFGYSMFSSSVFPLSCPCIQASFLFKFLVSCPVEVAIFAFADRWGCALLWPLWNWVFMTVYRSREGINRFISWVLSSIIKVLWAELEDRSILTCTSYRLNNCRLTSTRSVSNFLSSLLVGHIL